VYLIPCSGIGKPIGTVSRNTVHETISKRPDESDTGCLALLTSGDSDAIGKIKNNYCITLDGCAKQCAKKNTEQSGRTLSETISDVIIKDIDGLVETNNKESDKASDNEKIKLKPELQTR